MGINTGHMLQRMQTIWLLLAAASAFLTFKFSFYSGNILASNQSRTFEHLTATTNMLILIITVALTSSILIDIFLYKNRKLQMRIVFGAILVSLLVIFLYYKQTLNFVEGNYDLSALLSLAIPVFLILAARGMYKDEKLVKSLDRLR